MYRMCDKCAVLDQHIDAKFKMDGPVPSSPTAAVSSLKYQMNGRHNGTVHCNGFQKDLPNSVSPDLSKSDCVFGQSPVADHQNGRRSHLLTSLSNALLHCLGSHGCTLRLNSLRTPCALPSRHDVLRIVVSAVPYICFLLFYAVNPYTRVLPVAEDILRANLRNISAWESHLFPWPIHLVISSAHFLPLDFLAAVPYLGHYVIPVLYPVFLYSLDRLDLIQQFYRLLGLTMWCHVMIWLFLPTLPPWALDFIAAGQRSNATRIADSILLAHKEGPAFARIDSCIGYPFFYKMFVGNPVPFGSFPSGHVAWPMCILLTLPANFRSRFSVYVIWMAWATLYTGHHYVLDIVGALTLVVGLARVMGYVAQTQPRCPILSV